MYSHYVRIIYQKNKKQTETNGMTDGQTRQTDRQTDRQIDSDWNVVPPSSDGFRNQWDFSMTSFDYNYQNAFRCNLCCADLCHVTLGARGFLREESRSAISEAVKREKIDKR